MAKKKFKQKDFMDTCDKLWQQFTEDRQLFMEQYMDLKTLISGSPERYSVSGDTLCKSRRVIGKIYISIA